MAAIMEHRPPLTPIPPVEVRKSIPKSEWQECIQSWTLVTKEYLSLPLEMFETALSSVTDNSLIFFLSSYMSHMGKADTDDNYLDLSATAELRRNVFLIVHRCLFQSRQVIAPFFDWRFLGDLSRVYRRSSSLTPLLEKAWLRHGAAITQSLNEGYKTDLSLHFERGTASAAVEDESFSLRLLPLLRACPSSGTYFLTGSDFSDAVASAYQKASSDTKPKLILLMYLCLLAPLQAEKPNQSLVFDHLYSLKTATEITPNPFLSDLISNTPFISKFRKILKHHDETRARNLTASLEKFRHPPNMTLKSQTHHKIDKGKGKVTETVPDEVHVHRMSLVTQIQDLFPHLGSGFIVKLLDEYADDVEVVIAHLLEDDLPPQLSTLNRSEKLSINHPSNAGGHDLTEHLAPRPTPPRSPRLTAKTRHTLPSRHNIHANDPFDDLRVPASKLHFGRREDNTSLTANDPNARTASKAAIFSALSAFDADDDERDDTYDLADVGGTVDTTEDSEAAKGGLRGPVGSSSSGGMPDETEAVLFAAYKSTPEMFARDAATRRSAGRKKLRVESGLTDEGVEGWGLMALREPRRLQRLEARFALGEGGGGGRRELGRTAWTANDEEEDGTSSGGEFVRGGFGGRGRGQGRGGSRGRGGGGGVAGPSGDKGTQASRQRKESSKGSRANHNRRDQRAKKMARGGLPG